MSSLIQGRAAGARRPGGGPPRRPSAAGPSKEDAQFGSASGLPVIEHAGLLEDLAQLPPYLDPEHVSGKPQLGHISCSYCGVGDSGVFGAEGGGSGGAGGNVDLKPGAEGKIKVLLRGRRVEFPAKVNDSGQLEVSTHVALTQPGGVVAGEVQMEDGTSGKFMGRAVGSERGKDGRLKTQRFASHKPSVKVTKFRIRDPKPTTGCVKLRISTMRQRSAYPIHVTPSVLNRETGKREAITYPEAISKLADMVMEHRMPQARSLIYASGQLDYFTIFAMQEVFRLLGIRNLTGNAEHCLNAGAVHNEILTGQEGPFLTIDQALNGPDRVFLMNGWNGMVTHPPVFQTLAKRKDLDGYLVEVMVTETAKGMAQKMGPDRILLIKPRSDTHLALGVAHEIFELYSHAIEKRFIDQYSDQETFEKFKELATSPQFAPDRVAERIAPEPHYEERILKGIRMLAVKLADPDSVPIIIPSVGLSQTSGVVAHCVWGSVCGMLGKYGLKPDGNPAGGVLRVPGQINAESEVQGLSRKYFVGRVKMEHADDAAARMGLPAGAYQRVLDDTPRAALDYSDPTPDEKELFLCFGTQFEANMPNRRRWLDKLQDSSNTLAVIDPIPDPWTEEHADLIIPAPPHPATTKLYQNGEWKLSLSVPQKRPAPESRSDATIIYDLMAEITKRLQQDPELASQHADLVPHVMSGYLQSRFCAPEAEGDPGLVRADGEVSRAQLFARIQDYLHGGSGPLYCSFDHADGTPITWEEMLEKGSLIYGGVGVNRYMLDYDDEEAVPFRDVFRNPSKFKFFVPTQEDLDIPDGIIMNSGRSTLTDDRARIMFATSTFNSGKATPVVKIPDENPLFISPSLAEKTGLETGQKARVGGVQTGQTIELPVVVSDRVKGDSVYVSFHRSKAQTTRGLYVNDVTDHVARCPYSAQVQLKLPQITLERADARKDETKSESGAPRIDMTILDTEKKIPLWTGTDTPLYVTDIFQETHDVYTFRFQGDPLCRFAYKPGQFCSLILNIDGKKVVRSYSISSTPTRPYVLELTVKRVPGGLVSNWLPDNLKVGDRIQIKGPKGKFCLEPGKIPPKVLLVGAGSGVTPVMSMARWLCDISADIDIRFYCSVRTAKDIVFGKEIEMMTERYRQFTPCLVSTTRGANESWTGLTGRINRQMLEIIAPDIHERHVYMCGPDGFMETVKDILRDINFDISRLHLESFGGTRASASGAEKKTQVVGEGTMSVSFAQAGKTIGTDGQLPLLELAEEHDIDIEYGCRSGSCGDCKVKILKGEVDAETNEGLTEEEVEAGYVLTCVAAPKGDCVVDA